MNIAGGFWKSCVGKEGETGRTVTSKNETNLELENGDASNISFLKFSFLSGRTLNGVMFMIALPTLLYSAEASSPKPRNMKKMTEDTGMDHQDSNARLRDRELIKIQT